MADEEDVRAGPGGQEWLDEERNDETFWLVMRELNQKQAESPSRPAANLTEMRRRRRSSEAGEASQSSQAVDMCMSLASCRRFEAWLIWLRLAPRVDSCDGTYTRHIPQLQDLSRRSLRASRMLELAARGCYSWEKTRGRRSRRSLRSSTA